MIVIVLALIGALLGAALARRRQGTRFDIAQYAIAHAILFAILGLFATIIIEKLI